MRPPGRMRKKGSPPQAVLTTVDDSVPALSASGLWLCGNISVFTQPGSKCEELKVRKASPQYPMTRRFLQVRKISQKGQDLALVRAFHHRGDGRRYSAGPGVIFRMNGHDE